MGRFSENPRYNILSIRVDDDELREILAAIPRGKSRQYLRELILEVLREPIPGPVVCAWCNEQYDSKEYRRAALKDLPEEDRKHPVTHGICPTCYAAQKSAA